VSGTAPISRTPNKPWPTWLAPTLALSLIVGIAAFFFWYWLGASAVSSVTLSPQAIATASQQYPVPGSRPRIPAANQGLLARLAAMFSASGTPIAPGAAVPAKPGAGTSTPAPAVMTPLRISAGSITQARAGGQIDITSGPYMLVAIANGKGRPGYHYKFNVRADAVLGPDDAKLLHTAYLLVNTPIGQQSSGAPPEQIAELKAKFGTALRTPPLQVPETQLQSMDQLWLGYLTADAPSRQDAAIKLLNAVAAEGPKALAANQQSLSELVASVRQMLPPSQEEAYSQAMSAAFNARNATRRSTTQPGT
jgi:hypothetical protein